jgi:hypothetical protein
MLYIETKRALEGKKMIDNAIANIPNRTKIHQPYSDITDIDAFFNEFFKGYYYTQSKLEENIVQSSWS